MDDADVGHLIDQTNIVEVFNRFRRAVDVELAREKDQQRQGRGA
ncbi:MAG: hypothetical protein WKF28_04880 [Rubrobacteraceae bacterium]